MNLLLLATGIGSMCGPAFADINILTAHYTCELGVAVPATYFNADEGSAVVITVDGRQIT